jgi:hypothetical protein
MKHINQMDAVHHLKNETLKYMAAELLSQSEEEKEGKN